MKEEISKKHKTKRTIVLLDSHAILHRAYHAMPGFRSSKGEPTGALYGLAMMVLSIIKEFKPEQIIACFDMAEPTFRDELYKEYKGKRQKIEDDLIYQLNRAKDLLRAFDIPVIEKAGFEADDILGTIVEKTKKERNLEIIIASGDMDTMSLLHDKRVRVYTLKTGIKDTILYDAKKAEERYGIRPELIPDYKALRGDPSDNIIGVAGIGEKTGTELIQKFGSIDEIYKKLKKNRNDFLKAGIKERIVKLLEDNEDEARFSLVLATIRTDAPIDWKHEARSTKHEINPEKVKKIFEELGFRSLLGRISDIGEAVAPPRGGTTAEEKNDRSQETKIPAVQSQETEYKIKLAQWVLDSNESAPSGNQSADGLEKLESEIKANNLERIYRDIELPLIPILRKSEDRGIMVDKERLGELKKEYQKKLDKLESEIHKAAGVEFNINSPKQVGEVLFEKLGIGEEGTGKKMKRTSTGQVSTNVKELEKLKGEHPAIDALLAYRELAKLLSTYIDAFPDLLDKESRLHTHFVQWGSATGRLSSRDPNMQNIPIKTEQGRAIREIFIAPKDYVLASFDYSQIDLRSLAVLSGDEKLISFFKSGGDIHADVASALFKVPKDKIDKEMRRRAKVINFGIIYGMGVLALKANLGSSRAEAEEFLKNYFETFSGVTKYLEETKLKARKLGYTETLFGRRRYYPGINSGPEYMQKALERQAQNAPVQGTSADIIKIAMIEVDKEIEGKGWRKDAHLLLQIHDELLYEIKKDKLSEIEKIIKEKMESVVKEKVAFPVKYSNGPSWGDL
ncbi:MAG TPA: DNA polymerase [Candidatus Paceibacterota bacterium]